MLNQHSFKLLVAILLFLAASACSSDHERKTAHYQKAVAYFEKGDFPSAEMELRNAVRIDPTFLDAQVKLGETYLRRGNMPEAFNVYSTIVHLDPDNHDARLKLALFYQIGKKVSDARSHVDTVLASDPYNIQALFMLAGLLEQDGNVPDAMSVIDGILQEDQCPIQIYWGKAQLFVRQGQHAEAETILKQALEIDPANLKTYLMLFQLHIAHGRLERAALVLDEALIRHPHDADLLITKATLYGRMNEPARAGAALERAMAIDPQEIKVLMVAAEYYESVGQHQKAGNLYKKAIGLQPENIEVLVAAGRHCALVQDIAQARSHVNKVLALQPQYVPARLLVGEILLADKKYEEAAKVFQEVTRDNPTLAPAHYFNGMACSRAGNTNTAKSALIRTLELDPKLSDARLLLAELYLREGAYALAAKESRAVLVASPDNYQAHYIYGMSCFHQDKAKAAKTAFEAMIALMPEKTEGYYRLGVLQLTARKPDAARAFFEKALALDPSRMDVFTGLIQTEMMEGSTSAAIDRCNFHLEAVAADSRAAAVIQSLKGAIYRTDRNLSAAEASFKTALELDPDYPNAYYELARVYMAANRQEAAIDQCQALLAKNPNHPSPHMLMGILYEIQDQRSLAETHYRKALEADPLFAPAANNLACLLTEQDINAALAFARVAKAKLPNDPTVADTLGWIYCLKGLYDDAIRELYDSAAKLPGNPEVQYHLGMAYAGKQENASAKVALQKALALNANFNGAEKARKKLAEL